MYDMDIKTARKVLGVSAYTSRKRVKKAYRRKMSNVAMHLAHVDTISCG